MIQDNGKLKKNRKNPNDPARFIEKVTTNQNGEVVEEYYSLDNAKIADEAMYDGFYGITTNLEDDNIKARPVYLQTRDRIEAHFLTCFISLIVYRILSNKLNNKYTVCELLKTIRNMELLDTQYNGYIPTYTRTDITDDLHKTFGFRTDYEIIGKKKMRNIIKNTKLK